jgi:uncharacterized membrane protein
MRQSLFRLLLLSGFLFGPTSALQGTEYIFTTIEVDFPSPHDVLFGCGATGSNDVGQLAGACNDLNQNSEVRGFVYKHRRFTEVGIRHATTEDVIDGEGLLSFPPMSVYQYLGLEGIKADGREIFRPTSPDKIFRGITPQDINNQGRIVGWYSDGIQLHGFSKTKGRKALKLTVPESTLTEAVGINDDDAIVGDYQDQDGFFHAFLYREGVYTSIDVPFIPGPDAGASGINNFGEIVGCYSLCGRGFLYKPEAEGFLSIDVPGSIVTQARDINDHGQIVGVFFDGLTLRGFLYDGNEFTFVHAPGAISTNLFGINNLGEIVGSYVTENTSGEIEHFAFVATPVNATSLSPD